MAQLVVRNLEDAVKERLRARAARNGHSMEEEVRDILRSAVMDPKDDRPGLGTRIAARFAFLDEPFVLPERRFEPVQAVDFTGPEWFVDGEEDEDVEGEEDKE